MYDIQVKSGKIIVSIEQADEEMMSAVQRLLRQHTTVWDINKEYLPPNRKLAKVTYIISIHRIKGKEALAKKLLKYLGDHFEAEEPEDPELVTGRDTPAVHTKIIALPPKSNKTLDDKIKLAKKSGLGCSHILPNGQQCGHEGELYITDNFIGFLCIQHDHINPRQETHTEYIPEPKDIPEGPVQTGEDDVIIPQQPERSNFKVTSVEEWKQYATKPPRREPARFVTTDIWGNEVYTSPKNTPLKPTGSPVSGVKSKLGSRTPKEELEALDAVDDLFKDL